MLHGQPAVRGYSRGHRKSVFDVIQQRGGSEFEPIRDVVLRTLDSIEKAAKQKETSRVLKQALEI